MRICDVLILGLCIVVVILFVKSCDISLEKLKVITPIERGIR